MSYHPHDKHLSDIPPTGPPLHVKVRAIRQLREHAAKTYINGRHHWRRHCEECPVCGTISAQPPCPEGQRLLNIAAGRDAKIETVETDNTPAAAVVKKQVRRQVKPRRVNTKRKDKVTAL